ncbi:IclR family transcriptional regulator [Deinococcus cavernae]|uniref:IclR family transcriptional regulator n=1 Tax=Deinococcus cavernae TaxID=2320857 RepID=A0A418UZG5_9DEIO|nr:IclR family transcriptional regulator [Deinococcus cavernae]RJF68889.1 IclR family transcriptional regulator [Deinococcus cavernae]
MTRSLATVDAAVCVLEAFDADHTEWSLSELARQVGQPTSTVHEQLTTLTHNGLLMKVGRGRYRLGWRLLKLSSALYGSVPWYGPAHDAMNTLARGTHALAFLAVLNGPDVLCIARSVQGREGESVVGETQFVLPAHASASGKLLYALHGLDLPPEREPFTPRTGPFPWVQEAALIRSDGLASTRDEWSPGTSGLAVALRDARGDVVCALGLSFPSGRWAHSDTLVRRLRDAAADVNWKLGHRPPSPQ